MRLNFTLAIVIFAISFVFALSAFIPGEHEANEFFFVPYFINQVSVVLDNVAFFIIGILGVAFISSLNSGFDKKISAIKKYTLSVLNAFLLAVFSVFLSYILLLSIAFIELNAMAVIINANPRILGLATGTDEVVEKLKSLKTPPHILASENDRHKMLVTVAAASSGEENIYAKNVLSAIPSFLVIDINTPKSSVLMLDDRVIFADVNREELEIVAPYIAGLLAQSYFYDRNIKAALDLSVVDVNEYVEIRQEGIHTTTDKVVQNSSQNEESIATASARIDELETLLASNQGFLESSNETRNANFKECIATLETPLCQAQRDDFDELVRQTRDETEGIIAELDAETKNLERLELLRDVRAREEEIVEQRIGYVSREHGIFEPPNEIVIPLDNENERTIVEFFTIFIHEYLHYASYISEEEILNSSFFEEGLTEYFARNILKRRLEEHTNLGYPLQVKIVEQMNTRIHESEFANIYFSKDKELLEFTLDKAYGDGFYEENRSYLEALQYISNQEQLLQIANSIMDEIGGEELTKEDLVSSFNI